MSVQVLTRSCSVDRFSADRSSVREWELGLVAEAVLERIGKLCSSVPPSFWPFPPSPRLSRVEPSPPSSNGASPSRVVAHISCSFPIWHIDSLPFVVLRWGCEHVEGSIVLTILPDLTRSRQSSSCCDHSISVSRAHRSSALVVTSDMWSPGGEIDAADRVGE